MVGILVKELLRVSTIELPCSTVDDYDSLLRSAVTVDYLDL